VRLIDIAGSGRVMGDLGVYWRRSRCRSMSCWCLMLSVCSVPRADYFSVLRLVCLLTYTTTHTHTVTRTSSHAHAICRLQTTAVINYSDDFRVSYGAFLSLLPLRFTQAYFIAILFIFVLIYVKKNKKKKKKKNLKVKLGYIIVRSKA